MKITDLGNGAKMHEYADGTRFWWLNGKLHCYEGADGTRMTEQEYDEEIDGEFSSRPGYADRAPKSPREVRPDNGPMGLFWDF